MKRTLGFTLLEMSVVIVVIGLVVGGVVVGRNLIDNARINGTISQLDKYRAASSIFENKYNYLPGDIPSTVMQKVGIPFCTIGTCWQVGYGDGNGVISSARNSEATNFWMHLSYDGLIEGQYKYLARNEDTNTSGKISDYLPQAKLGENLYFYVWGGGLPTNWPSAPNGYNDGLNYMTIDSVSRYCGYSSCGVWGSDSKMQVMQAYNIDKKIDDGLPNSGNVWAIQFRGLSDGPWSGTYAGRESGASSGFRTVWSNLPSTGANPPSSVKVQTDVRLNLWINAKRTHNPL